MAHDSHQQVSAEGTPLPSFNHPISVTTLLATFAALVMFTIVTVVVAKSLPMGRFEIWVSLGIATVKALLVMLFFMHMLHDKPFNVLIFISGFVFAALFMGLTLSDSEHYQDDIRAAPSFEGAQTTPILARGAEE
ncbi:MAG: cytochrome C oxidase subunit IV family protein [Pirellulaceae bacterium]|nr:cytochrome C oxidase subunit IV family protein [Planctomycetales bacterium]